jgi:hypothetical protein
MTDEGKGFLAKIFGKLDKKLEEKSKQKGCCCCSEKKDSDGCC